jgi:mRNA interferase HigB
VHVISRKALREFALKHPRSEAALDVWFRRAGKARWTNLVHVREDFPHADAIGKCIVFNIAGNHYRLIAEINFKGQTLFVRAVLTHKEYDTDRWKDGC